MCGFSLTSPLLGRQFSSTLVFPHGPNRYTRHSPVRQTVETQTADPALLTQTSLHPSCTTTQLPASQRASGAPLLPRAHASWSEGEGPYHPRCRGCLQPPQAHTLSKFLQLPPGFFVSGKNQAAETTNLCPSPSRTPSRTPDASTGTFGCTCVTLSLSIHYRSARVTQAVEHSPVLWGLHMMFCITHCR